MVVGVTVYPRSMSQDVDEIFVNAVDRSELDLVGTVDVFGALAEFADKRGAVPTHGFRLSRDSVSAVFDEMKHAQLVFRPTPLRHCPLVTEPDVGR